MEHKDELYGSTEHYREKGWLGGGYQTYLDAIEIIEERAFDETDKKKEKEALDAARKKALGNSFFFFLNKKQIILQNMMPLKPKVGKKVHPIKILTITYSLHHQCIIPFPI